MTAVTLPSNTVCECPHTSVTHESDCDWALNEQRLWAVAIAQTELRLTEIRAGLVPWMVAR